MTNVATTLKTSRLRIVLAFAAIYLIWGSTYLAIRFALETMPPFYMAGVRFLISGAALYLWSHFRDGEKPTKAHWYSTAVIGLLMVVGGTGGTTFAETLVPSGLTALMIAAMPFWMVLLEWIPRNGKKPSKSMIGGLLLGFAGILILVKPGHLAGSHPINPIGAVILLCASFCWANGSLLSRKMKLPKSQFMSTGMEMLIGGAALMLVGAIAGETPKVHLDALSIKSVFGLFYLITFGALAFFAYLWLVKASTPAKASTYAFVNPVVAVILGALLGGEELSVRTLIAAAVIISAVVVITLEKVKRSQTAPQDLSQEIKSLSPVSEIE